MEAIHDHHTISTFVRLQWLIKLLVALGDERLLQIWGRGSQGDQPC